jgi:hypothetical protein
MTNKNKILGITILEWHSVDEIPTMHVEEYASDTWMQSEPLLLADAAGGLVVGDCQQANGRTDFDPTYNANIGEIRMWALLGKSPAPKEGG